VQAPCVAPSEARGPSALTRLGMTSRDAVPNEVRDASLMLGRTDPPCSFREVIAMKKYRISGVELDRLKILSDYALHLSYRQALDAKKVEEVAREGVK
jgi:hypothetical protein